MAQKWKDAGDAFVRAAEVAGAQADAKHDMATHFAEAANCYRKVDTQVGLSKLFVSKLATTSSLFYYNYSCKESAFSQLNNSCRNVPD